MLWREKTPPRPGSVQCSTLFSSLLYVRVVPGLFYVLYEVAVFPHDEVAVIVIRFFKAVIMNILPFVMTILLNSY